MDPKLQTSFIPKKSLAPSTGGGGINLFSLVAVIIFILALVATGGVYFYKSSLATQIEESEKNLERARVEFDPAAIEELISLNNRIEASKQILANHTSVSALLHTLEKSVLKTIRFDSLNYNAQNPQKITVSVRGQAVNYASIAYQSDVISKNRYIKVPIFSDLNIDQSGRVVFSFTATIDRELLLYRNNIGGVFAPNSSN